MGKKKFAKNCEKLQKTTKNYIKLHQFDKK